MVRVVRLERTVSWSQTRRDTNFAIPGYSFFCHDTMARGKNKDFSVCGQSCGQSRFYAAFSNRGKSRKCRCHKALRHFALPRPGYRHGTPKPGAIPTSLYPDIHFSAMIPRRAVKIKFFLSAVKAASFSNWRNSCYRPRRKALRRFDLPRPGYRHGTPKPGALPTPLYPGDLSVLAAQTMDRQHWPN